MGGDSRPTFELRLFGGFDLERTNDGGCRLSSKKAKALLCYMAVCHDRPSSRDKVAGLLWEWLEPVSARNNLRQVLLTIRQATQLTGESLLAAGHSLTLNKAVFQVDVWQFERLLAKQTTEALCSAAGLYQGELLEGMELREFAFSEWLMWERERFRRAALSALGRVLEQSLATGTIETAQHAAIRTLTIDPVDESAHRALMSIYARKHRYALAVRQYQICREALERELNVEPDVETRQLYSEIIRRREGRAG